MANQQRFNLVFDFEANMGSVKSSMAELQKTLGGITLPPHLAQNFEKLFGKLNSEMSEFEAMAKNGFTNMGDVSKAQTSFNKISKLINQITQEAGRVKGIDPNKLIPKEAQNRVNGLKKKLGELQAQQAKKDGYAEQIRKQTEAIKKQETAINGLKARRKALAQENSGLGAAKGAQVQQKAAAEAAYKQTLAKMSALEGQKGGKSSAEYKALGQELTRLNSIIKNCDTEISRLTSQINRNKSSISSLDGEIGDSESSLTGLTSKLTALKNVQVNPQGLLELRQELAKLLGVELDEIPTDLTQIQTVINGLNDDKIEQVGRSLQTIDKNLDGVETSASGAKKGMKNFVDSAQGLNRSAQDVENLKNQFLQFFSLTNAVQLFKRAITSALNTVKELDATMTEAAVVTEFDIGDMWSKLPQYSKEAQKLGVSINGMYQATTLYYQQGLKTNEAMQLGIETMKMAKIAGMESAEATEAMTAALRGFNMELNETSATRVNDVYSQLAAVTAADTEQIATAMSKTASIAASANMEFETTAALLAQIIETTQEAPETAGTAMKTIIARFSEVKSLREQGKMSGQDSEGEDIDVNKIQTALRSVGISMDGFFKGTEGLDSILLELAEKWDTLDFETQRYIATMAAGSRQQSRFIAMMSDYKRTQELVSQANNSAGASQDQFNKTLDSMETKLQKLENAWQQFLMGLANNEVLKGAIDLLTDLVEALNKMVGGFKGGFGDAVKSLTSLLMAFTGIKVGKKLLGGGLGWAGAQLGLPGADKTENSKIQKDQSEAIAKRGFKKNFSTGWNKLIGKEQRALTKEIKEAYEASAEAGLNAFLNPKKGKKGKQNALDTLYTNNPGMTDADKQTIEALYLKKDGAKAAAEEVNKLGYSFANLEEQQKLEQLQAQKTQQQHQALATGAQVLGGALIGAGAACGMMAQKLEESGDTEAAEGWSKAATALTVIGSIVTILPSLIAGVKAAWVALNVAVNSTSGIIGLIVLALTVIIAIVIAIVSAINKSKETLSQKLERVKAATKDAQEAAEKAKQAYDDLLSGNSKYKQLQKDLSRLTHGTQEWTTALLESNSQVMELIDTYPELAKYVTMGEHGQLQISQGGWEEAQAAAEAAANTTAAVWMTSKAYEYNLEAQKAQEDRNKQLTDLGINQQVEELFQEYLRDPTQFANAEFLETWGRKTGGGAASVKRAAGIFAQYLVKEQNAKNTGAALIKSGLSNYISDENKGTDYANDVTSHFSDLISSSVGQKRIDDETNALAGADSEERTKIATELGITIGGSETSKLEDLQKIYAKMMNVTVEDIDETLKKDVKGLSRAIANGRLLDEYGANANKFIEKTRGVDQKVISQAAALLSGNPSSLTYNDTVDALGTDLKKLAEKLGYGSSDDSVIKLASDLGYKDISFADMSDADKKRYVKDYHEDFLKEETNWQKAYDAGSGEKEVKGQKKVEDEQGNLVTTTIDGTEYQVYEGDDGTRYIEYNGDQYKVDSQGNVIIDWTEMDTEFGGEIVSGQKQMEMDQKERKEQIDWKKQQIDAVFKEKDMEGQLTDYVGGKSIEVASAFASQISTMGADAAQNYAKAWSELPAEVQDYIAQVDWSNMAEASEAMEYMQSKNVDPSIIQNFWRIATESAGTYVKTLAEALQLTDRIQKKVSNVNNIEKAFLEGTATYEDMLEFAKAGVDVSKFQLTDTGWKATAEDIAIAKAKMLDYYAAQAKAEREVTANKLAQDKKTATEKFGFVQDENGNWKVNSDSPVKDTVTTNEQGNLVAKQLNRVQANSVASKLGLELQGDEESTADYISRIQTAYNEFLNNLNDGDEIAIVQDKTVAYTELAAAQGSLDAGAKQIGDSWDRWQKLLKSDDVGDRTKALGEMQTAAKKLLDVEEDLSEEFLTNAENQDLMKRAAEGDKEALQQLRKAAAKDVFKNLQGGGEALANGMQEAIDKVANADIEVGVTVTLNEDDPNVGIANSLTDQYNAAYQAVLNSTNDIVKAQQAGNAAIAANGYVAPEMVEEKTTVTGELPAGYTYEPSGTYTDPTTGVVYSGIKAVEGKPGTYTYTTTRLVPKDQTGYTKKSDTIGGGGSKGGSSGGGSSKYKNSHDKQYNSYEKVNQLLREREKIERRYNKLMKDRNVSYKDILKNQQEQLDNLKEQEVYQRKIQAGKSEEIQDLISSKEGQKYKDYFTYDEKTGLIQIDWEKVNKLKGEKGEGFDEFLSKLEGLRDQWQEAQDALDEIEDNTEELREQGKEDYFDLENQIKDALIAERQKEIDKLSEINDSINDTNSKILDSLQEQIDEYRQNRDNEKTEEELSDKQRRLAYLQQDTSGANATEILNLQKEIEEGQESYTDQLIDQKISELQKQNDQAAEQRERQIALMESQLQHYEESGEVWKDVYDLMNQPNNFLESGALNPDGPLANLLKETEAFQSMSKLGQEEWWQEIAALFASGFAYVKGSVTPDTEFEVGDSIRFKDGNGNWLEGVVDENGNVVVGDKVYEGVYKNEKGEWVTDNTGKTTEKKEEEPSKGSGKIASLPSSTKLSASQVKNLQKGLNELLKDGELEGYDKLAEDGSYGPKTKEAVKILQAKIKARADGIWGPNTKKAFDASSLKAYKSGGLADFTGPAWLDGTKSKPEYILNADQTKAFFTLVDILSGLTDRTSKSTEKIGDTSFDIDINVESIGSDYDVEQIANKIKSLINEDARYRNNNVISLMR